MHEGSKIAGAMQLKHHFLLSMPGMAETNIFSRALTYICQHDKNGAMGLIVNREIDLTIGDIFLQMNITPGDLGITHRQAHMGGPVDQKHGFVLHSSDLAWSSSVRIGEGVSITSSRGVLESLACGRGPKNAIIALGYAGWTAGQLELELQQNAWLTCPASAEIIFEVDSEKKLDAAAASLGIDFSQLSSITGHA